MHYSLFCQANTMIKLSNASRHLQDNQRLSLGIEIHFFLFPSCALVATAITFEGKRVFFLAFPWFLHRFRLTYNLHHTENRSCISAIEAVWGASPIPDGLPVGALRTTNFPGLLPCLMASRFLWDFCKIPQKSSFFVILGWRRRSSLARRSPRYSFISRFQKILINFIIDLSFLEI